MYTAAGKSTIPEKSEREHRSDMVRVLHLMYHKGYIASADGNVSIRLSARRLLLTPSGVHKGLITENDLVITDYQGNKISGKRMPTSEFAMHKAVYELRPDVNALVHAHPPVTLGFSVAGVSLAQCVLPEVVTTLGTIPNIGYATPTTQDVPSLIREPLQHFDAMILDRHGTLCVGKDIFDAFNRLETVEHTAKITLVARSLGKVQTLPKDEVDKLIQMSGVLGVTRAYTKCTECGSCSTK